MFYLTTFDSRGDFDCNSFPRLSVLSCVYWLCAWCSTVSELSSSDDDGDGISLAALKKKAILKKKAKAPRSKTKVITAKRSKPIKQPASKRKKKAAARKSGSSAGKSKSTSSSSSTGADDSYMEVRGVSKK